MWLLSIKQTAKIISTYAGDTSGVCSALFELGGMTVMHDPSGCNSTYGTHDEPRWYTDDSLVFISALTEAEAILGNDEKLYLDTLQAARELRPNFIALAGSPIPSLIGVDLEAVARRLEHETGITSFGFDTDGMHSYISGADIAFKKLAERIPIPTQKSEGLSINILGATPLDFSVMGIIEGMKNALTENGIEINSCWAMGGSFDDIKRSAAAHVNLVISSAGLSAAKVLSERFGTPYIIATPCGEAFLEEIIDNIKLSACDSLSRNLCKTEKSDIIIIGESVTASSLASALALEQGLGATVISATEVPPELLNDSCIYAQDEDDIVPLIKNARLVIADPLYEPIIPSGAKFVSLPHEAFSGRIYHSGNKNLVTDFHDFLKELNI